MSSIYHRLATKLSSLEIPFWPTFFQTTKAKSISFGSNSNPNKAFKKSVFSTLDWFIILSGSLIWAFTFFSFLYWWFSSVTILNPISFTLEVIGVLWLPFLGLYLGFFVLRQQKTITKEIPAGRIALITTKIPSEPWPMLQRTLTAMLTQKFPRTYDVWLADEDPTDEVRSWCNKRNIKISTRKNHPDYFNATHPRRAQSKEGNLTYFYDHFGYTNYDFVLQFDADHAPDPGYLTHIMREFNDPKVGYVAAPSLTDGNLNVSWTVPARCHWESATHGVIQSGATGSFAPMCFGSHYALRTSALKQIGGIGPELAEDHTTTMLMQAGGWRGGFARDAVAHGFGAVGLVESMYQEFQWATSMVRTGLLVTPKHFKSLPLPAKFQFVFWQAWYPLVSIITLISIFLPLYSILFRDPIAYFDPTIFWLHYSQVIPLLLALALWLRLKGHLRPTWSWQITWETIIFQMLQFPWILFGVLVGLWEVLTSRKINNLKTTDKDNSNTRPINIAWFWPHLTIIWINLIVLITIPDIIKASSFAWFALFTAFMYTAALGAGINMSIAENWNLLTSLGRTNMDKIRFLNNYLNTIILANITVVVCALTLVKILISI
jgi:cellulose synthase (UDP-forming)